MTFANRAISYRISKVVLQIIFPPQIVVSGIEYFPQHLLRLADYMVGTFLQQNLPHCGQN
jgi:hypothetical protein